MTTLTLPPVRPPHHNNTLRRATWQNAGVGVAGATDALDALRRANLDFTVEKRPLFARNTEVSTFDPDAWSPAEGSMAVCRTDTGTVLGVVSDRYEPYQNADMASLLDGFGGKLQFERAGSFDDGARCWLMAKLGEEITPKRFANVGDTLQMYLRADFSHDGSGLGWDTLALRLHCKNGMTRMHREARHRFRHTTSVHEQMEETARNLYLIHDDIVLLAGEIDCLADRSVTDDEARAVFDQILFHKTENQSVVEELLAGHREETERQQRRNARILDQVLANYETDPAVGTAWGVYNALSEYTEHQMTARGGAEGRLKSSWFGRGQELKVEAFQAALALAN